MMKKKRAIAPVVLLCIAIMFSCNKNDRGPLPILDGTYEGESIITTLATQDELTDSVFLSITDDEYEYQGRNDLNEGSGYYIMNHDSIRFIDYRATLFEHWDWILRGTYKYTLEDSVLTLHRQTTTKTYHYDLKMLE